MRGSRRPWPMVVGGARREKRAPPMSYACQRSSGPGGVFGSASGFAGSTERRNTCASIQTTHKHHNPTPTRRTIKKIESRVIKREKVTRNTAKGPRPIVQSTRTFAAAAAGASAASQRASCHRASVLHGHRPDPRTSKRRRQGLAQTHRHQASGGPRLTARQARRPATSTPVWNQRTRPSARH